jgi:Kef-type K+ transport system membrane component KefB
MLDPLLITGVILLAGFILGELAARLYLPKVTGYIIAGILMNPQLFDIVPVDYADKTDFITRIALSFITFSVGGSLLRKNLKKSGKSILSITLFEAEMAFIVVTVALAILIPFIHPELSVTFPVLLAISLLLGSFASPTDPSATLAIVHEYKAKGPVTNTIMGVAALDDIMGIINYTIAVMVAQTLIMGTETAVGITIWHLVLKIGGAVLTGVVIGFLFNLATNWYKKDAEGGFIVIVFGFLITCYGLSEYLKFDALLSTMTMGIFVVNTNRKQEKIFNMLARYTDELIFVLFFTLSGMQLNFSTLLDSYVIVMIFILFRAVGKVSGTWMGAKISGASPAVKKYTAAGLLPQGGIVIGLALILKPQPAFSEYADLIISIIIGATVIHELLGPISSRFALLKAKEIVKESPKE